jgi:heptaprenyl diphosphate synthase
VERHAAIARAHLAPLPDGDAKDALLRVCADLVDRTT